jgi:hypothetical protein
MSIWDTSINWDAPLTRRAALRGAGAVLALPFLESWAARLARGAAPGLKLVRPPLRMAIYTVTGGTVLESWRLPKGGPLPERLPSILRPLEPFRGDLLVLTGLSHNGAGENVNGHEHCAFKHLTGAAKVGKASGKPFAGVSVDQAAARVAGNETILASLEFGLSNHETRYSFRGADELVPYEADPRLVFDRMFKGREPVVPNWRRRASARAARSVRDSAGDSYERSVVDSVREEARSLRGRLARGDREKLDRYLDTVRSVETRIDRLEAVLRLEAADAKDPGPSRLVRPRLRDRKEPFHKLLRGVYHDPEHHAEYIRVMSDLLVMALQTDTTRVATVALGDDGAMFPGVVTVGHEHHCHTLEHQGNAGRPEDADPIAREALRQIHAWYTGLFAEAVGKMKEIDEGGSTLLDNTLLLYTSYMADGGHGTQDYPVLLAGGARGTLRTGRQIDYEKKTPMSNLFVEMLRRMGAPVEQFGESATSRERRYAGRLPGLV